jgi:methylated-DNA-[protein]-cysteine S-methyltransferase
VAGITYISSPLGIILIESTDQAVSFIHFLEEKEPVAQEAGDELTAIAAQQLREYFDGTRQYFDFPFLQTGTVFQQKVWQQLLKIECGQTQSYLELARKLGDEKCIRAAASANGKNNLAIVVPCHRVIGSGGKLVGYAGGLWRKQWLLEHEAKMAGKSIQGSLF